MSKKKVVVALGHKALGATLPQQQTAVKNAAKAIADLVEADCQVVISHSNAPQVGMIHTAMNEFGKQHPDYTFAPMSVCSAMSQGYIGYDLQNAIREELLNRGIGRPVTTILTQVVVNPYDDSFYKPVKVIGRVMTREEADAEEEKGNYVTKVEGGYRRIVSAPKPEDIVEIDAIKALMDADQIVIACGGGGIPVYFDANGVLIGAEAVIDKDLSSSLLASSLCADLFVIATDVKGIYLNWAQTEQKLIRQTSPSFLRKEHFAAGSMGPKVEAVCRFVEKTGKRAVIGSLEEINNLTAGLSGTRIGPDLETVFA